MYLTQIKQIKANPQFDTFRDFADALLECRQNQNHHRRLSKNDGFIIFYATFEILHWSNGLFLNLGISVLQEKLLV